MSIPIPIQYPPANSATFAIFFVSHAFNNKKNHPFFSHCRLLEEVEAQNEQLAAIEAESQQIQVALEAQEAVVADLRRRREEREAREAEEKARNQAASSGSDKKDPPPPTQ